MGLVMSGRRSFLNDNVGNRARNCVDWRENKAIHTIILEILRGPQWTQEGKAVYRDMCTQHTMYGAHSHCTKSVYMIRVGGLFF